MINFKKYILISSIILILLFSCGFASATNDTTEDIQVDSQDIITSNEDIISSDDFSKDISDKSASDKSLSDGGIIIGNNWIIRPSADGLSDANSIQKGINYTCSPGDTIKLNEYNFTFEKTVILNKNLRIMGGNIYNSNGLDNLFTIVPKSEDGPNSIIINGTTFYVTGDESIVLAQGENLTSKNIINIANITIINCTIKPIGPSSTSDIYGTSLLNIESDRTLGQSIGDLNITNNTLNGAKSVKNNNFESYGDYYLHHAEILNTYLLTNLVYLTKDRDGHDYSERFLEISLFDENGKALANKPLDIIFNGSHSLITDNNGTVRYLLKIIDSSSIKITFNGDDDYLGSSSIFNLTFGECPTYIDVDYDEEITSSDSSLVEINFYDDFENDMNGFLEIYINNAFYDTIFVNKSAYYEINDLEIGENNIKMFYYGDSYYDPTSYSITIYRYHKAPFFNIRASDIISGQDAIINITLMDSYGILENQFDVIISDEESGYYNEYTISSGQLITIPSSDLLEYHSYDIRCNFNGEEYELLPAEDSYSFSVKSRNTEIFLLVSESNRESTICEIALYDEADNRIIGNVEVTFNNKTYSVLTKDNGFYSLDLGLLSPGNYTLFANFKGNEEYKASNYTHKFTVFKGVNIQVDAKDVYYGDSETVNVTVVLSDGKITNNWVEITVYDEDFTNETDYMFNLTNGKVSFDLKNITSGKIFRIFYNGYPEYEELYKFAFLRVLENSTDSVINATIDLESKDNYVIASLKDLDGKPLSNKSLNVFINGIGFVLATDVNGQSNISISGNSSIKVVYTDANKLNVSSSLDVKYIDRVVEHNNTKRNSTKIIYKDMVTTAVVPADGRIGKYFEVTLVDANGKALVDKNVSIGFNGKMYNRTTNATGGVKLQINLAKVDKYTFAIAFLGDDNYTGSFEVALITVNPQVPKLTASAKSFKASAKTKSISATFKTANGNAVKGKQISFTVNGKTYTAKTNSKGIATVKISLNKKGTYSATVKFVGDTTFKATSTKFNVKIA